MKSTLWNTTNHLCSLCYLPWVIYCFSHNLSYSYTKAWKVRPYQIIFRVSRSGKGKKVKLDKTFFSGNKMQSCKILLRERVNFQLENGEATGKNINSYAMDLVEIKLTITQHFIWKFDIFLPNIIWNKCLTDLSNFAGIIHRWKW